MLTFKVIVSAVAVVFVALSLFLMYRNWTYSGNLAEARAVVKTYAAEVKQANEKAAQAVTEAAELQKVATEQSDIAKQHAADAAAAEGKLALIRAAIPIKGTTLDTLAARIAASRESTTVALKAAYDWRLAYEAQVEATIRLQGAYDNLAPALKDLGNASSKLETSSTNLANASGTSFWKRLVPTVHAGITGGINPQGKPDVVAGIGLGWEL